jgi:hypothetical protein
MEDPIASRERALCFPPEIWLCTCCVAFPQSAFWVAPVLLESLLPMSAAHASLHGFYDAPFAARFLSRSFVDYFGDLRPMPGLILRSSAFR